MKILITGGAGFIGSAVIRYIIGSTQDRVLNIDKLTYAGSLESLENMDHDSRYCFERIDLCSQGEVRSIMDWYQPDAVMHLAAETHVDRSIDDPAPFIHSNVVGTYTLLEVVRAYWQRLDGKGKKTFRFLHVSTDEVFGDLRGLSGRFTEESPYSPSSPYSATKASSDHLVRAWGRTYGLPVLITNCSNNYGPYQFPEKLIPMCILNALEGKALPIYGRGEQVRDWLFVEDHAQALYQVLNNAQPGKTYNISGHNEEKNINLVSRICDLLQEMAPQHTDGVGHYRDLITYVDDRPGHDYRYSLDASKIHEELGWTPQETLESSLRKTVAWYLDNMEWCERALLRSYQGERLGVIQR